jgi:hypothetical protein
LIGVPALGPGKVVVDLEVADVSAVGKRSGADRGKAAAVGAAVADGDRVGHERLVLLKFLHAEQSGVPQVRAVNVLTIVGVMTQVCVEASLVLTADADGVVQRIDRAGAGGLNALVAVEAEEQLLAVGDVSRRGWCSSVRC